MPPRMRLEGIYTPVITPFSADGDIDYTALAELIERLIGAGAHGLISGGSTGENYAETIEERLAIARFVTERAKGQLPVIVGTGAMRTPASIALAVGARDGVRFPRPGGAVAQCLGDQGKFGRHQPVAPSCAGSSAYPDVLRHG